MDSKYNISWMTWLICCHLGLLSDQLWLLLWPLWLLLWPCKDYPCAFSKLWINVGSATSGEYGIRLSASPIYIHIFIIYIVYIYVRPKLVYYCDQLWLLLWPCKDYPCALSKLWINIGSATSGEYGIRLSASPIYIHIFIIYIVYIYVRPKLVYYCACRCTSPKRYWAISRQCNMWCIWCAFNSSPPGQSGRHFADDMFKCIFLIENIWNSNKISLIHVPWGVIDNMTGLVQIMAWRRPGAKAIIWTNVDSIHQRIYAALGGDELSANSIYTCFYNLYKLHMWDPTITLPAVALATDSYWPISIDQQENWWPQS